jgi:hypothetical protein
MLFSSRPSKKRKSCGSFQGFDEATLRLGRSFSEDPEGMSITQRTVTAPPRYQVQICHGCNEGSDSASDVEGVQDRRDSAQRYLGGGMAKAQGVHDKNIGRVSCVLGLLSHNTTYVTS